MVSALIHRTIWYEDGIRVNSSRRCHKSCACLRVVINVIITLKPGERKAISFCNIGVHPCAAC